MKCAIITGPYNFDLLDIFVPNNQFIIGADIGAYILAENKISFDLAIGDFDSAKEDQIQVIKQFAKEVVKFPIMKNYTDTFLAVEEAKKRGYHDIEIYGGIGNRIDHTYANILLTTNDNIKIISTNEKLYTLHPGVYNISNTYRYISFFALDNVEQLSLSGFEYELFNYNLSTNDPLCISNMGSGTITFTKGKLLVIHQNE